MTEGAAEPSSDARSGGADRRGFERWIGVGLFALAVAVPLLRQRGTPSWDSWLFEDLVFYYGQADVGWGPDILFEPYTSGYLVLFPRLLAVVAQAVPVERAAVFHAVLGTFVVALLAWFVYHSTRDWIASRPVRLTLAALVVVMPAAGPENTATTVNSIWALAAVTPWALISLRERARDVVVRCLVVFFAATALPLPFLFAPLAIGWAWYRRTRAAVVVSSTFGAGLVLQAFVMLRATSEPLGPIERPASEIAQLFTSRTYGVYLTGSRGAVDLWRELGLTAGVLSTVVVTALFAWALIGAGRRAQVMALVFYAYGAVSVFLLVWWRGTTAWRYRGSPFDIGVQMRYSVPATLMIASAFALVLAPPSRQARDRLVARIGRPVFIGQLALVTLLSFSGRTYRSDQEPWTDTVATARRECAAVSPTGDGTVPPDASAGVVEPLCRKLRP